MMNKSNDGRCTLVFDASAFCIQGSHSQANTLPSLFLFQICITESFSRN